MAQFSARPFHIRIRRECSIAPGRVEGHGKRGKPLTADCVLEYRTPS